MGSLGLVDLTFYEALLLFLEIYCSEFLVFLKIEVDSRNWADEEIGSAFGAF
jgi:hypothetical protein